MMIEFTLEELRALSMYLSPLDLQGTAAELCAILNLYVSIVTKIDAALGRVEGPVVTARKLRVRTVLLNAQLPVGQRKTSPDARLIVDVSGNVGI